MTTSPSRVSVSSRTSIINPTQGLIPSSLTEIYLKRFQGWLQLTKNIIKFFEITVESEKKSAESLARNIKELNTPCVPHLFNEQESFQILFKDLLETTTKQSQEHLNSADMIESQILPILRSLSLEIRKKAFDVDREWVNLDKEMAKDRDTYLRLVSNLRSSLIKHQWKGDLTSPVDNTIPKDPWLANTAIKQHASICVIKQEEYRKALLDQEAKCCSFETVIYQNLKVALSLYFEWKSKSCSMELELFRVLKSHMGQVDNSQDWATFMESYSSIAPNPSSALVTIEDLTYDGHDDPLTKSIKEGSLFKKESGVFKSAWKSYQVILTGAGYFHLMKPDDSNPELSLDLTECTVGPLMLNDREPEEFTISEKSGGIFGRDVKHKVKGKDMDESAKWWGILSDHVSSIKKSMASNIMDDNAGQFELANELPPPIQASFTRKPASIKESQNGSSVSVDSSKRDSASSKRDPPLPPRKITSSHPTLPPRSPSNMSGTMSLDSSFNASHFQHETSMTVSEIPNTNTIVNEIPGINPHTQTDIPLTLQMEMAFQQATIIDNKTKEASPWDEDNVWT